MASLEDDSGSSAAGADHTVQKRDVALELPQAGLTIEEFFSSDSLLDDKQLGLTVFGSQYKCDHSAPCVRIERCIPFELIETLLDESSTRVLFDETSAEVVKLCYSQALLRKCTMKELRMHLHYLLGNAPFAHRVGFAVMDFHDTEHSRQLLQQSHLENDVFDKRTLVTTLLQVVASQVLTQHARAPRSCKVAVRLTSCNDVLLALTQICPSWKDTFETELLNYLQLNYPVMVKSVSSNIIVSNQPTFSIEFH
ncbi:MAG: hypothetical protein MHM6MM_003423 [Cercozoa sp. M6MM]